MTHDEKRLYLVGQLLTGGVHRSPAMVVRAVQLADVALAAMASPSAVSDASEDAAGRHDTMPMPDRGPDDTGHWKPIPFDGEQLTHSEIETPIRFERLDNAAWEQGHGNNRNGDASAR